MTRVIVEVVKNINIVAEINNSPAGLAGLFYA